MCQQFIFDILSLTFRIQCAIYEIRFNCERGENMSLGKKIKELREQKGYTREDVASKLQISFASVQKWESDLRRPPLKMAERLAVLFGTTVSEMIGDTLLTDEQKKKAMAFAEASQDPESADAIKMYRKLVDAGYTKEQIKNYVEMAIALTKKTAQ